MMDQNYNDRRLVCGEIVPPAREEAAILELAEEIRQLRIEFNVFVEKLLGGDYVVHRPDNTDWSSPRT